MSFLLVIVLISTFKGALAILWLSTCHEMWANMRRGVRIIPGLPDSFVPGLRRAWSWIYRGNILAFCYLMIWSNSEQTPNMMQTSWPGVNESAGRSEDGARHIKKAAAYFARESLPGTRRWGRCGSTTPYRSWAWFYCLLKHYQQSYSFVHLILSLILWRVLKKAGRTTNWSFSISNNREGWPSF